MHLFARDDFYVFLHSLVFTVYTILTLIIDASKYILIITPPPRTHPPL